MKFTKAALGIALVAVLSTTYTSAFSTTTPHSRVSAPFAGISTRSSSVGCRGIQSSATKCSRVVRKLAASDDEEDDDELDGPLSKGVDSVAWLPTVIGAESVEAPGGSAEEEAEVLPLFPLGGIVYTPNSEHVLNIFEPRYRQMYTDILMNGSKRFVVSMSHPTDTGRFAQMGVLFELEELKEVSEQTADQIKYICNHKVTGRVKIHRVLNPEAYQARDTYLRVEGTIRDDSGRDDEDKEEEEESKKETNDEGIANDVYGAVTAAMGGGSFSKVEKELKASFADLVDIQHELEEDVRFTKASVVGLAVRPGPGKDGLWQTIRLWQSFADQRLMARQNDLQKDFQEKLQEFLRKEKGMKDEELPSAIGFQDLSPALQQEVQELQKRMAVELQPLVLESTLTMQKLLEGDDHEARCTLLKHFVDAERKRLSTKKSLAGIFSGGTVDEATSIPEEEKLEAPKAKEIKKDDDDDKGNSASIFTDEPDAWG